MKVTSLDMDDASHKTFVPNQGYALLAVTVFVLVIIIAAMAFFAMSSYETRQALYRQDTGEAFYLAEAAIERSRAKLIEDQTWRGGWNNVTAGRGEYDLSAQDTTFMGYNNVVQLVGTGRVQQATRRVEVMAQIRPIAFGLTLLIMGNADVGGNLCLNAPAHVCGSADFGPGDANLACEGEYTEGFEITPPPLYTDSAHYPNTTYYYVRGNRVGGVYQARIFNASGFDITAALGDSLTDVTTYDPATGTFNYAFDNEQKVNRYFDDVTGVFRRNAGDVAVVVNFGEAPLVSPPGLNGVAAIELKGSAGSPVHATIINTRFTGVLQSQRSDFNYWRGGTTTVKQIVMEPYAGLGIVAHNFMKQGGSLVRLGTAAWPALIWVTQDVVNVTSNFVLSGSLICLGNWNSTGGPNITYDPEFLANLPQYLIDSFTPGVSGTLDMLRWRELASASP